jgi:hypothetical protein
MNLIELFLDFKVQEIDKIDVIGICMTVFTLAFIVYPFILVGFLVIMNLDPYYFIINEISILSDFLPLFIIATTFRCIASFVMIIETCRLLPLMMILSISLMKMTLNILKAIETAHSIRPHNRISAHINLALVYTKIEPFAHITSFFVTSFGLFMSVLFNFGTCKMFPFLPFVLYIYFPSVSFLIFMVIHLLFPMVGNVNEYSSHLIWTLQSNLHQERKNMKFLRKKIASLRPTTIKAGILKFNVFKFEKSTKIKYYSLIVNNTINLMLTVPL